MESIRYFVGGPSNSGKSTLVLSLVERLRLDGRSAEAVELDVWSNSYPAFAGEVTFEGRPKRKGLDWDWQTPLAARLDAFNASTAEVVFGDMPGARIDAATDAMCRGGRADAAIVVSATTQGLEEWTVYFASQGIRVAHRCLTFKDAPPHVLTGLCRTIQPDRADIGAFAALLRRAAGT